MNSLTSRVCTETVPVNVHSNNILHSDDLHDYVSSAVTSPCVLSMLSSNRKRITQFEPGAWGFTFQMYAPVPLYISKRILEKNESCCENNPCKIKMKMDWKNIPATCTHEDITQFLNELEEKLPHPDYPLHPLISREIIQTLKTSRCILCDEQLSNVIDGECEACRSHILTFIEVMHSRSLWIPVGWDQYISHRIPSLYSPKKNSIEDFRFSIDARDLVQNPDANDIRTYVVASMSHCSNRKRIPTLETICIRNICKFVKSPCPDDEPSTFLHNLKKSPYFPTRLIDIFQNLILLFYNTQLNICPPHTTHDNDDATLKYYCQMEKAEDVAKDDCPFSVTREQAVHNLCLNAFPPGFLV